MRKLGLQGFLSLTVVILLLALVSEARAALLYEQDFVTDPSGVFSNIGGQVGADQFTLQVDATVTAADPCIGMHKTFCYASRPNLTFANSSSVRRGSSQYPPPPGFHDIKLVARIYLHGDYTNPIRREK